MNTQIKPKTQVFSAFINSVRTMYSDTDSKNLQLKKELHNEVDGFIEAFDDTSLTRFIDRGYNLTVAQAIYLVTNRNNRHNYNTPLTSIETNILKVYQQEIAPTIATSMMQLSRSLDSYGYSRHTKSEKTFESYKIFEAFSRFFADNQEILFQSKTLITDFLPVAKKIIKKLDLEIEKNRLNHKKMRTHEATSKFRSVRSHLNYVLGEVERNNTELLEHLLNEKIDKYSLILDESDNMKSNMVSDVINNIKNFKETDLPADIKAIVDEIRAIYREITPSKLNSEQKLELNNLYNKRFPQVLEEYITVSPRYKEKLKSHNENPDTLLFESLSEIKTKINDIFESIQETNLTKMKVTHRYLKNI